ncbi:integrin beta-PS-like isoform X1 [Penaeus japonicus]|uniref:integrin beta-PS-like isoform X1 n=1 Tax=Penaeus japonicus TaxID=27405 RepID=UPI001C715354|nr:integrin beta-PS-like isoform X1 [Penaeus japonicus]XP_042877385.1 integrin beta-PS-like isoform X2 [Penaeus japonicus]XP_042877386.1 integrin beta-PS-like isoform X1 [Penaeus japonicus]
MKAGIHLGIALCALWALAGLAYAQESCNVKEQCSDCIQTQGCMWCSRPKTRVSGAVQHHCIPETSQFEDFCDAQHIENPRNTVDILEDEPLSDVSKDLKVTDRGRIIQLAPQRLRLKLRKGVTQHISVTYRQATDYPVDLYYLMDLSNSMLDDKQNLAKLGAKLADTMRNLTTQFKLGFGSFVDKVLMPFADTAAEKLERPCKDCAPPYSFKNDLPLDSDSSKFTAKVDDAPISGNMDAPEGGFDALMQAMVCKQQIGWRDKVRKIIVFSTDAKFHHAGDGRLAGIVRPNDEQCHLDDKGIYNDFDKYDYPSVAQINKIAQREEINVIFAVSGYPDLYESLSKMIDASSFGVLDKNSANVVELVKEQYERITSKIKLGDNLTDSSPVTISYSSKCHGSQDMVTNECDNMKEGSEVVFDLSVTAMECPADGKPLFIEVKTLQDKLIMEVEFDCNCGCEETDRVDNATQCHGQGALVCGVCACYPGYRGDSCRCTTTGVHELSEDESQCIMSGDTYPCSNQGYCSCGACVCDSPDFVSGKYCQCNRRLCSAGDGKECSGHGTCECDKCKCKRGYQGQFCECEDNSKCIEPGKQKECSGHGECKCGKCRCNKPDGLFYSGQYCEDCQSCSTGKCGLFRDCVQCKHFGTGVLAENGECNKCEIKPQPVDYLDDKIINMARLCTFEDSTTGCYFNFTYLYMDNGKYSIYVQREQQCPEPAPVLGIVFGLVAAIVAIGLLTLLIWKLLTTIHDRREYAKFEDERRKAQWNTDANPLYRPATNTFQNPAFAKQQAN